MKRRIFDIRDSSGLSLVELLIASTITVLLIGGLVGVLSESRKASRLINTNLDATRANMRIVEHVSNELKYALDSNINVLPSGGANNILFTDSSGISNCQFRLNGNSFVMIKGSVTTTIVDGVQNICFIPSTTDDKKRSVILQITTTGPGGDTQRYSTTIRMLNIPEGKY
jgi:hypothetical protein